MKKLYMLPAAAAVLALAMYLGYRWHAGWEHDLDWWLLSPAHTVGIHHHGWVRFWSWVSAGLFWVRPLTLVATGAALATRRFGTAVLLLVCGFGARAVSGHLKELVHRPRPATMLVFTPQTSFPSGHAFETTAGVCAILVLLVALAPRWRRPLIAAGMAIIAMVGLSRVALNVHHPSDVIAGWSLGALYFGACWVMVRGLSHYGNAPCISAEHTRQLGLTIRNIIGERTVMELGDSPIDEPYDWEAEEADWEATRAYGGTAAARKRCDVRVLGNGSVVVIEADD